MGMQQYDDEAPYEEEALSLAAGAVLRLQLEADYIGLIEVDSDVLRITINQTTSRRLRLGSVIRPRQPIRSVVISNPSGGLVTGIMVYGKGSYLDNRTIIAPGAGTLPVSVQNGSLPIVGLTAHDAAVATAPVLLGAEARATERAAVSDGDVVRLAADLNGRLLTLPYANPENWVSGVSALCVGAAAEQLVIAAPGAGVRLMITDLLIGNDSATGSRFQLLAGPGGTVLFEGRAQSQNGQSIALNCPLRLPQNTALYVKQLAAASIACSASGYKGA